MTDQSRISVQMMLPGLTECISSPESVAGITRAISRAGAPGRSGPALAPASLFPSLAEAAAPTTNGICGPTSFASSVPPGPLSSWESRLRARLATVGSTEFALIWRVRATPAGRLISRLAPWTPPTSAAGSTGSPWPTATANDFLVRDLDRLQARRQAMKEAHRNGNGFGLTLGQAMMLAAWATPTLCGNYNRKGASPNSGDGLATQMLGVWASPKESDHRPGMVERAIDPRRRNLNDQIVGAALSAHGQGLSGSGATTAGRVAPNPAHPCWLQGYPTVWLCGAGSATRYARHSRRK